MSDTRPSQSSGDDGARLLRGAARRHAVARTDLFLSEGLRLSERERLTARDLLRRLLRTIEDELRAGLADRFSPHQALHAALASAHVEIAGPAFADAEVPGEPELVALLLRRIEEHRLFGAARGGNDRLAALLADRDGEIAADAMAVLIARSRRLDRFHEPVFARTELPAEWQHRLVWTVAAVLRTYLTGRHRVDPSAADLALSEAVAALLAGYDEADSLEARCSRLARRLHAVRRLDGAAVTAFLVEGTLPLFLAGLSAITGISATAIWDVLSDPAGRGPVLLLRAAGLDRQEAGQCLLLLTSAGDEWLIEQVDLFDAIDTDEAARALSLWALDPAYRDALLRLDAGRRAA